MRFDTPIDLLVVKTGKNENGFKGKIIESRRQILSSRESVRSSEFYAAAREGYKLSLMFKVHAIEYNGESFLSYKDIPYEIVRTYEKGVFVELTCQKYDAEPLIGGK